MMNGPVSIRVIGSINLDIVASGTDLPRAGETVTGAHLAYHPGGKGANQALAAQRLGGAVTMVGAVGQDGAADQALALLRSGGVDLKGVQTIADQPTGIALIAVGKDGENQIIVAPGANAALTPDRLGPLGSHEFDATICQLEIPLATVEAVAAQVQGFFAINLAPAQDISPAVLKRADLIVVNETEAAFYGDKLQNLPGLVVLTLGAQGARMSDSKGAEVQAAPPPVKPVDTTGAGDTFVGALVLALMEGQDRRDALAFACAAGAAATLSPGAQSALPTRAQVLALMGANP
jgi:ribokinase